MSDLYRTISAKTPKTAAAIIRGEAFDDGGAHRFPVVDPSSEETISEIVETSAKGVDAAVSAAREVFASGDWSRCAVEDRRCVLTQTAALIREHATELASLDTLATGLLFHASTLRQAHAAADWFDYFASLLATADGQAFNQTKGVTSFVSREPIGVAALFSPWNIPLMSVSLKLAAALAMGNSCVIKPSEQSPFSVLRLLELLHDAGLPKGVVNVVNGRGEVTGAALAAHSEVDVISFTGGEVAGKAIQAASAERFARTTMELGGKSANIVFADADIEKALDGSVSAIYGNNGQACLAGSRILLHRSIADRFIAEFINRTKALRIGLPFDELAQMGPQSSKAQMDRVLLFAGLARDEGMEILCGGERAEGFDKGYFVKPTAVLAQSNASKICQDEIFGPFAAFLIFDDADEAVAIANDTRYGLAAYLWTRDLNLAMRASDRLRAGTVLVNTTMVRERNAPFGGFGQSGLDREGGRWSLDFYSEAKTTIITSSASVENDREGKV